MTRWCYNSEERLRRPPAAAGERRRDGSIGNEDIRGVGISTHSANLSSNGI